MKNIHERNQKEMKVILTEGKCCTSYCGDCVYFNYQKTSYGKCWCGYYETYSHKASDSACSHFKS